MSQHLIQFSHLFKSFGQIQIFDDISLSINQGDIFALIGENGTGKTSLLKLLTGEILPDSGEFSRSPSLTIEHLPQEPSLTSPLIGARAYLEEGRLAWLEQQMTACLQDPARLTEWAELHERYEQLGGYRQLPIEKVLNGLKLETSLLDFPLHTLSSGQRVRLALARVLIKNPALLLLDEPTNHLDKEMLEWLENTLSLREGATIIVSHDRKFLNATCNRLIEIKAGKLTCYGGSYDFYLVEQQRLLEKQMKAYEAQEEERKLLKQQIKRATFSKGKPPPPTDRDFMAYDSRGEHHQKSLQRHLNVLKARLAEIEANPLSHPMPKSITGLRFSQTPLNSAVAIELENISKTYGEKVLFSEFNRMICRGDRIILTGPNGSGKTTLLRCLAGLTQVDAGQIRHASRIKIAYLDQEVELLPMAHTPLEYFKSRFNQTEEDLRRKLHQSAIGGAELLHRPFFTLSTGQRKRLMLLSLILEQPNVLLLDEPTNHLDFLTLEALETALLHFEGAIVAVSHDTTFIDKIATQEWLFPLI